ncbi:MAG: glycosyltransferase family 2 protein [Nocardioides sp.]
MTDLPAVTAVVPTHNRPEMMRRAVQSILDQEYDGDVEVIIVFDACDPFDPPLDIPARRKVRTVTNTHSRGLAGARNTGIDAASYEYVAFLDDDDYWLQGKLAAQMPYFLEPEPPVLVGTAMMVDDGQRTFDRLVPVEEVTHAELLRDRMAGLHSSTFVFSRAALTGPVGMADEDLPGGYGEDYDFLLRSSKVGRIHVVNRPLVSVTWAGQSYFFGKWSLYADGLTYLLAHNPEFETERASYGRICGQIAFSRAAAGERRAAWPWIARSLRHDVRQMRSWLAAGIALRVLSAPWVIRQVQKRGKGI